MAIEINDENKESVISALSESGYVVRTKEDDENFKNSFESVKKETTREIWDKMDKTIFDLTGMEKLIRDDNGRERTVDYYQRALTTTLEDKKNASKQVAEYKKSLDEVQTELEALKSDNPEAKYEEKFKELKSQLKAKEEELSTKLSEKDSQFKEQLFNNKLNSVFDSLRGQLKNDIPYVEDIFESKKRNIAALESKVTEDGKQVFYKDGQPLLNDDGTFKSVADIARGELIYLFDESKAPQGTGGESLKSKTLMKFSSKQELDQHLQDKYGSKVGSVEWINERAELLASSGLK